MLRSRKITVGKYYVNHARTIAREVLASYDKTVLFITYHLNTGNSCSSPSECLKRDFIHWADHEATPTEIASLQYHKVEAMLRAPQAPKQEKLSPIQMTRALEAAFEGEPVIQSSP